MRFSIVICTYNRDKYLGNSIRSACDQDFPEDEFEVLVVDNNSTDKTANVCKDFSLEYSYTNFRYFLETNQGISYGRNRGIGEAYGEYIVFLDDDETIDSFYLKKLNDYLHSYPQAQLCATAVEPVYETEKPKWLSHFTMRLITGYYNKGNEVKTLGAKDYPGTGHAVIKRELFERYGNFNTDLGRKGTSLLGAEDKDMFLRLIENKVACYYFPGIPIYHHIPQSKLTDDFFKRLTYSIGKSERIRTKAISKTAFRKRLFDECIKWAASWILLFYYIITLHPSKGWKLIQFRWNVSKGLLGK